MIPPMTSLFPLGDRAFLASFADEERAAAWAVAVRAERMPGVLDVVLAYHTVAVFADPDRLDPAALEDRLRGVVPGASGRDPGRLVRLPVLYDGVDLAEVAGRLGLSQNEVIREHSALDYLVFAIGFLPGFPYAGYLPSKLSGIPRREPPRTAVPAGSVAIAGRQTGVYPARRPAAGRCSAGPRCASPTSSAGISRSGPETASASTRSRRSSSRPGEGTVYDDDFHRPLDRPERGPGRRVPARRRVARPRQLGERLLRGPRGRSGDDRAHPPGGRRRGVVVGAHPGYADRDGFGRRELGVSAREVESLILDQFQDLQMLASEAGSPLRFVKPHGALYNQAQRQEEVAAGVTAALARLNLPLLGQPGSVLESNARRAGVRYVAEGFPDRRYLPDGRLVPRNAAERRFDRSRGDRRPGRPPRWRRGSKRSASTATTPARSRTPTSSCRC